MTLESDDSLAQIYQRMIEAKVCSSDNVEEHCRALLETLKKFGDPAERDIQMRALGKLLRAIGNEHRFKILMLLKGQKRCFIELEYALGLSQPTISYHVKALEDAGLIQSEKRGKWTSFSLCEPYLLRKFWQIFRDDESWERDPVWTQPKTISTPGSNIKLTPPSENIPKEFVLDNNNTDPFDFALKSITHFFGAPNRRKKV